MKALRPFQRSLSMPFQLRAEVRPERSAVLARALLTQSLPRHCYLSLDRDGHHIRIQAEDPLLLLQARTLLLESLDAWVAPGEVQVNPAQRQRWRLGMRLTVESPGSEAMIATLLPYRARISSQEIQGSHTVMRLHASLADGIALAKAVHGQELPGLRDCHFWVEPPMGLRR